MSDLPYPPHLLPLLLPGLPLPPLASPCLLPGRFWGRSFHLATPATPPSTCRRAAKSLVRRRRRRRRRSRPTKGWLGTESWALQHGSTAPLHHCTTAQCNPQRRAYGSNLRNSVGSPFRCPYPTAQVTFGQPRHIPISQPYYVPYCVVLPRLTGHSHWPDAPFGHAPTAGRRAGVRFVA